MFASSLGWVLDVVGMGFDRAKGGLSYILALCIPLVALWLLFHMLTRTITSSLSSSLSPICRIPGTQFLDLPFCPPRDQVRRAPGPGAPVEFDQLMVVQSKFEEVLEQSAGSVSLPLDMKRGEASIRDLRQRVRYSSLQSKSDGLVVISCPG